MDDYVFFSARKAGRSSDSQSENNEARLVWSFFPKKETALPSVFELFFSTYTSETVRFIEL